MNKKLKDTINTALKTYQATLEDILTRAAVRAYIAGEVKAHKQLGIPFSFDLVQKEALEYAKEYGRLLKGEGASIIQGKKVYWLKDSIAKQREEIFDKIEKGVKEGKSMPELTRELNDILTIDGKWRAERIARTEVARIQSLSAKNRYKKNNIKRVKWLCGPYPCPICQEYCGKTYNIGDIPEVPLHPSCTCSYAPIVFK